MLYIIRECKLSYDGQSPKHPKALLKTGKRFLSFPFQERKGKSFLILDVLGTDNQSSHCGSIHVKKVVESDPSFLVLKDHFPDSDHRAENLVYFFIRNLKV